MGLCQSVINIAILHGSLLCCFSKNTLQQISLPFPMHLLLFLFLQAKKKTKPHHNLDYATSTTAITIATPFLLTSSIGSNEFLIHKNRQKIATSTPVKKGRLKNTHLLMKTEAGCGTDGRSFSWKTFCLYPKKSFVEGCETQTTRCPASRAGTQEDKTSQRPLFLNF